MNALNFETHSTFSINGVVFNEKKELIKASITEEQILINGKNIDMETSEGITLIITGNVTNLTTQTAPVSVKGNVHSLRSQNGDVTVDGSVGGIHTTNGDVSVRGHIAGAINAQNGEVSTT